MQVTIGADPELFVKKAGKFASGHGLIPGTKVDPFKVDLGAVQVDGMALEFNIDPATTEDEFYRNISSVMRTLKGMIPKHKLVIDPTATFSDEIMKNSPKEALELGCDPDFNAYTGEENPRPEVPEGENIRTAAGHIHVGWTEGMDPEDPEHFEACCMMAKQMDYYVGIGSLLFDHDIKRRMLYGQAGAFRPKSYGMEYRVLSNAWLRDEAYTRWVYKATKKAFEDLVEGKSPFNSWEFWARAVINKEDYGPNTERCIRKVLQILNIPEPC